MHAEGSVLDIAPLSGPARILLPRLPIADGIFSTKSAEKLRRWQAQFCEPTSNRFDPAARVPFTPRRKSVQVPADAVLLELTVYPDATRPSDSSASFLVRPSVNLACPPHPPCRCVTGRGL
jgi:hypothetical protein